MTNKILIGLAGILLLALFSTDYLITHHTTKAIVQRTVLSHNSQSLALMMQNLTTLLLAKYTNLQLIGTDETNSVGYSIPGYSFQVVMPTTAAVTFTDRASQSESVKYIYYNNVLTTLHDYLVTAGFVSLPSDSTSAYSLLTKIDFYKSKQNICQITSYTLLDLSCQPYAELQGIAAAVQPMVALYQEAVTNLGTISVVMPTYTASKSASYRLAVLTIYDDAGEMAVNYYQHGTTAWQMIPLTWYNDPHEDGSVMPNCQDFMSSTAIASAYYGLSCYDSNERSMATIQRS
jgi:hypothetical protein